MQQTNCVFWDGNSGSCLQGARCPHVTDHIEGRGSPGHPVLALCQLAAKAERAPVRNPTWRATRCLACQQTFHSLDALQVHFHRKNGVSNSTYHVIWRYSFKVPCYIGVNVEGISAMEGFNCNAAVQDHYRSLSHVSTLNNLGQVVVASARYAPRLKVRTCRV